MVDRWPIDSVHDRRSFIEPKEGFDFFWRLRFVLGGRAMSLHELENEVIRDRFEDPRIHFVLNCASGGCPPLRPQLPRGEDLEPYLARSAREFLADPANVRVDHGGASVSLSPLFDWYRDDFLADLARRGVPPSERTLLNYIAMAGGPELAADMARATAYSLTFPDYDWSINVTPQVSPP